MVKKNIMELLKEISRFVCIDKCGLYLDYKECKKCKFMVNLNKLMKEVLG